MNISGLVMIGGLMFFMFTGIPVPISVAMAGILTMLINGSIPLIIVPQKIFVGGDSFPLLAVVFFLIAGELMLQGGISKRLVNLASSFFRNVRGNLALISLVTCAFFGALSGSGIATTAAVGNVMYPEMQKDGSYDDSFSLAIQGVGGTLGTMIPPSITLILYGMVTGASIGNLFMGCIVPGIVMCACYCVAGYIIIRKRGMATNKPKIEHSLAFAVKDGIWAMLTPVIILGGIYTGIFSATESAAIACLYALIIGVFFYRELNFKTLYSAMYNATLGAVSVMLLIACSNFFCWVMTTQGIPQAVTNWLIQVVDNKYTFLIAVNIFFLFAGMFMDVGPVVLITMPLLVATVTRLDINLIHFGCIACVNLSMGQVTPPFGNCLFVACGMDKRVRVEQIYREVIPFCLVGIIGILITTYFPILSTWVLG